MSRADNQLAERTANDAVVDLAVLVARLEAGMSSWTAQLRGMTVNDVLDCEMVTLDATGIFSRDWTVPFAAVAVANTSGNLLTVTSDPPQAAPPSGGAGSHPVGPGAGAVINLTGRALTIYGAAGNVVGLQVFTRPQAPAFGQVATNATAALAEPSTLLLAGATANGATRIGGENSRFRAFAAADVAGTLNLQQSRDGVVWYTTVTQAVGAGSPTVVESIVTLPLVRAQYVNGATNQATFEFDTALVGGA